jgi:hypothetical protein
MPGGWWKKKSNRFRPSSTLGKAFRSQPMLLETHVISHRKNTTASICRFVGRNEITDTIARDYRMSLALQLPFMQVSESMGNHDSKIVDAASVD